MRVRLGTSSDFDVVKLWRVMSGAMSWRPRFHSQKRWPCIGRLPGAALPYDQAGRTHGTGHEDLVYQVDFQQASWVTGPTGL